MPDGEFGNGSASHFGWEILDLLSGSRVIGTITLIVSVISLHQASSEHS